MSVAQNSHKQDYVNYLNYWTSGLFDEIFFDRNVAARRASGAAFDGLRGAPQEQEQRSNDAPVQR